MCIKKAIFKELGKNFDVEYAIKYCVSVAKKEVFRCFLFQFMQLIEIL